LSVQSNPLNNHAAVTRTSHLTYTGYLAADGAGRIASDLSPVRGRAPQYVLPCGRSPSFSFDPFLKLCGTTVTFDSSSSIGMISAGVEASAITEIDSATSRGEFAIAGDIAIGGATVLNGVIAKVEANATNEPTAGPGNVTNEPIAKPENVPNEPNPAETEQSIATKEPTAGPENVTNEPTARPENAPNEPNSTETEQSIATKEPTAGPKT
jgi:hypothetical protein